MSTERDDNRDQDESEHRDQNREEQQEDQGDNGSENRDEERANESENADEPEEEEPKWSWIRPECQGKLPAVNVYYRSRLLEEIEVRLTSISSELCERFRSGCFGHFLRWKGGRGGSGRALYGLISRQIYVPDKPKHELWFRVCGHHIKFSMPEFALITGLKFGPSEFDPTAKYNAADSDVVRRFCGGNPHISLQELRRRFLLSGQESVSEVHDDYLRVANLLVMYIFGMGSPLIKVLEDFAWKLVENLEEWNNFPWGAYCYKQLMYYFEHLAVKGVEVGVKIHFFGPTQALQIWSYEAIPALGKLVAKQVDQGDGVPRLLRWAFAKSRIEEFDDFFDEEEHECFENLDAVGPEEQTEYWITACDPTALDVRFNRPYNPINTLIGDDGKITQRVLKPSVKALTSPSKKRPIKSAPSARRTKRKKLVVESEEPVESSRKRAARVPADYKEWFEREWDKREVSLKKKMLATAMSAVKDWVKNEVLPQIRDSIVNELNGHTVGSNSPPPHHDFNFEKNIDEVVNKIVNETVEKAEQRKGDNAVENVEKEVQNENEMEVEGEKEKDGDGFGGQNDDRDIESDEIPLRFTRRKKAKLNPTSSDVIGRREKRPSAAVSSPFIGLMPTPIKATLTKRYQKWRKDGAEAQYMTSIVKNTELSFEFFNQLEDMGREVPPQAIDLYLDALRAKLLRGNFLLGHIHSGNTVIVDPSFYATLKEEWVTSQPEPWKGGSLKEDDIKSWIPPKELLEIVQGKAGKQGANWWSMKHLIFVVQLVGHYATVHVDLEQLRFDVYDSNSHRMSKKEINELVVQLRPLTMYLPSVLEFAGYWDNNVFKFKPPQNHLFTARLRNHKYQFKQTDEFSGAVYACMAVDGILTGLPKPDWQSNADHLSEYRLRMAQMIFDRCFQLQN